MNSTRRRSPLASPLTWLLLAPVLLVAIAWAVLAIMFPPARVRAVVEEQLHHALAREVRFANASIGLWPPVRLTVRQPELAEPGGFGNGVAFRAKAVNLDLDVMALLSRKLRVNRLALDQPALHLLLRADGSSNLDSLGAPPQPNAAPNTMDLDVREFSIHEGRVLVDDVRAARRTSPCVARDSASPANSMASPTPRWCCRAQATCATRTGCSASCGTCSCRWRVSRTRACRQ